MPLKKFLVRALGSWIGATIISLLITGVVAGLFFWGVRWTPAPPASNNAPPPKDITPLVVSLDPTWRASSSSDSLALQIQNRTDRPVVAFRGTAIFSGPSGNVSPEVPVVCGQTIPSQAKIVWNAPASESVIRYLNAEGQGIETRWFLDKVDFGD